MKLGFITAILDSWTYEEMMDFASEQGFECVEVACWPQEKAERRYAGVSHIDAERVNREDAYAEHIVEYAKKHLSANNCKIWCGSLDAEMTVKSYIVPGMGDAGDLAYGEKL